MTTTAYRGYTIEPDSDYPYALNKFIFYPTDEGIDHDYDGDSEGYTYGGNCRWAGSIEDSQNEIDEIVNAK